MARTLKTPAQTNGKMTVSKPSMYQGITAEQQQEIAQAKAEAIAKAEAEVVAQFQAQIAAMREENARLAEKAKAGRAQAGGLTLKVGEKGGISVYGLGRFPVSLYQEQWVRLEKLIRDGEIDRFIESHKGELKAKASQAAAA